MKKHFLTLIILVSLTMHAFAYDFQSGNLLYTIISNDPFSVSLDGHVDGTAAQGELIIPETVTYEDNVFTVVEISDSAFMHCNGLTGALNLPTTIKTIGERAFAYCSGFSELNLNEGLLEICEEAFRGCSGLTGTLSFPETIVYIKYGAFKGCNGFSGDLVLPNSVREVGNTQNKAYCESNIMSVVSNCFDHLILSQSLDTIGPYCFVACSRLKGDLVIPNSVKAIYGCAFAECTGFTSLILNDSLTLIDKYAFCSCSGIRGTVIIPDVFEVGINAFDRCTSVTKFVLPSHISKLHSNVFVRCSSLTEVNIPEGWVHTGNGTFAQCSNLKSVHLPESLRTIGSDCFSQCTNLKEINFPDEITSIGETAFEECSSLSEMELPANLRYLEQGAFAYCFGLTGELVIPDFVKRIESDIYPGSGYVPATFEACSLLTSIVLGDSINYVEEAAFKNTQLDTLVIKAKTPPVLVRSTYANPRPFSTDLPIVVPCGTLEAYQNAEVWNSFSNIIEDCEIGFNSISGSEWYYEILNDDGSITYQHLECVGDTVMMSGKRPKVIVRSNTHYNRDTITEVTHEYVYEEDGIVYWWNRELQEFTTLYNLNANMGDEWEIKVGTRRVTMQVDTVGYYEYDGKTLRMLRVSDPEGLFNGDIVCNIGHFTSFFPERLMDRSKGYRVTGLRCYWVDGNLVLKINRDDCDAIYAAWHNDLEEHTDNAAFVVYPNPANGVLFVETVCTPSLPDRPYRITNLIGQTLMQGTIHGETQQINIENLPAGMYFISVDKTTQKFVVR